LPTITQFFVLVLLYLQAKNFLFSTPEYTPPTPEPTSGVDRAITAVFLLTCLEGLCGGSAYVNTFYHVGHEGEHAEDADGDDNDADQVRGKMEREFRIGATGAADSCGILFASLISMPVEVALCNSQVAAGRSMCRNL
jgi:battenin